MKRHLLVIDVQNDFCPDGNLAVEKGATIIPIINKLSNSGFFDTIVATQDWHPNFHCSFEEWPTHCVQGGHGAELHPDLDTLPFNLIMRKGMKKDVDSYSAFYDNEGVETGLNRYYIPDIDGDINQQFYICGIATDVCVKSTAIDCIKDFGGNQIFVIKDACAPVSKVGEKKAIEEMIKYGVRICDSDFILRKK